MERACSILYFSFLCYSLEARTVTRAWKNNDYDDDDDGGDGGDDGGDDGVTMRRRRMTTMTNDARTVPTCELGAPAQIASLLSRFSMLIRVYVI